MKKAKKLTDDQIKELALTICHSGDDPEGKTQALLILMDEITTITPSNEADLARQVAFSRYAEDEPGFMEAAVQLLRGEKFGGAL